FVGPGAASGQNATISIANATLSGNNITIKAYATNDTVATSDSPTAGIVDLLASIRPQLGLANTVVTTSINLGTGTKITAAGTVSISAESESFTIQTTLGFVLGAVTYAAAQTDAVVDVASGVQIVAGANVSVGSVTKSTVAVATTNLAI